MPPQQESKLLAMAERHPETKMREWAKAQIASFYALRKKAMELEEIDPFRYGQELEDWKLVDSEIAEFRERFPVGVLVIVVFGGIRSSKTNWKSKRLVNEMLKQVNYKTWACHSTQDSSREAQQEKIYGYLPPEYRPDSGRFRHGKDTKVNYTPWGGFTDDVFTVPGLGIKPSECRFKFYSMNPKALEGSEINEGWMDEEAPLDWLDILVGRCTTRNGIVYLTFNAKNGFTQLVRAILNGAKTTKEVEARLLPLKDKEGATVGYEKVPKVQENLNMILPSGEDGKDKRNVKVKIIYFHTENNPYGGYEVMKENLAGASREKIMIEAYGIPSTSRKVQFPMFTDTVHIISLNLFREIQKNGGTWYHYLDPCSGRNWFMHWVFIDPLGRRFVVAEFPSYGHDWAYIEGIGMPEAWAIPGNAEDGMQGGGQKEWGWGYRQYVEEIYRIERLLSPDGQSQVKIHERWIDARYGNAKRTDEERPTTLIIDLSDKHKMDFLAAPSEQSINSGRGGGDGSLRMINDALFYDKSKPIDSTNTPKLFLVETCPNTEFALKNWTGRDGQKGASKDPIDVLRMLVLTDAKYVATDSFKPIVHSHFRR